MAKREAKESGYDEAILLDIDGFVAEGPGENIFICRNGVIKTTPLTSILEGITRDTVIELATELGIPVLQERFTRDDLYLADESFFTGTAAEVTPIREVEEKLLFELIEAGLDGIEAYYSQTSLEETVHYLKICDQNGLFPTGGSDFHGTNKPEVEVGTGRGNLQVPERLLKPLRERARRYRPEKLDQ